MRARVTFLAISLALASASARTAPAHDVCADLGGSLGVGVSSYNAAEGWPEKAQAAGVTWRFLYFYVFPSQTAVADMTSFIALKAGIARNLGATLVITFYDLLEEPNHGVM